MKKRRYTLLGIIAAISIAVVLSISVFNERVGFKRSLEGEWKLASVMVDGKPAPSNVQESDIDIIYYWDEQSIIFESETFHGFDGCNNYRGDFKLGAGNRLDISRIEYSLEGCPEEYVQISDHSRKMVTRYDNSHFTQDLIFIDRAEMRNHSLVLIDDGPPVKELFFDRTE